MSRARTRENFPRMKVRGVRRRRDAELTRYWRTVEKVDWSALGRAIEGIGEAAVKVVDQAAAAVRRFTSGFVRALNVALWADRQNRRNRWVATHQLPATVSPWAAPVQCTER